MLGRAALLAALALSFNWSASAEDLGVYGETFEITEEDLLHQIQRLMKIEVPVASGECPTPVPGGRGPRGKGSGNARRRGQGGGNAANANGAGAAPKRNRRRRRRKAA